MSETALNFLLFLLGCAGATAVGFFTLVVIYFGAKAIDHAGKKRDLWKD